MYRVGQISDEFMASLSSQSDHARWHRCTQLREMTEMNANLAIGLVAKDTNIEEMLPLLEQQQERFDIQEKWIWK